MAPRHLALMLVTCIIWGFNFVAAKVGVRELPPLLFTGLRFSIIALVLLPFLKPARGRMRDVVVIALFNGAIHFALMFRSGDGGLGTKSISPVLSSAGDPAG